MRAVALLVFAACGGPALGNVPHPNNAAMAGGAAAAAAAMTLADPDAATRKPEKKDPLEGKQPTDVKQNVPPDVFDRLDRGSGAGASEGASATQPAKSKRKGPPPKLPSPKDAADRAGSNADGDELR